MVALSSLEIHSKSCVSTFQQQQSRLRKSYDMAGMKEEETESEGQEADSPSLTGSFSAQLGCSNPYLYDQFSLLTTEQRINQIILLQVGSASRHCQAQSCYDTSFLLFPQPMPK